MFDWEEIGRNERKMKEIGMMGIIFLCLVTKENVWKKIKQ